MTTNRYSHYTPAMMEMKAFCELRESGASRKALIAAAKAMKDADNKKATLAHFGIMSAAEKRQCESSWRSIMSVTEKEAAMHCQFAGLPLLR